LKEPIVNHIVPGAFDRHAPLETKSEADPVADVVTAALDSLKGDIAAERKTFATRLDAMEARLNRPVAGLETKAASIETKAFETFLRRGAEQLGELERKALSVASNGDGGYLATPEFGAELLKLIILYSPVRQYAKKVTTGGRNITYPRRTSSLTASWVAEAAPRIPSSPTFEPLTITPYTLAAEVVVSLEILEDNAYDLEGELLAEFAEQFGKSEGAAFVSGTGVGQPVGLLTSTDSRIKVLHTGDAAGFPAGNPADVLIKAFHTMPAVVAQVGAWMMNRNTIAAIREMKDGIGRYLVLDGLAQGAPVTLLGRPIIEAVDMPDLAAGATPIMFGDFQGYRIVDRVQPTILRDPFTMAATGQVRFVGRKRVGADITHPDRFLKLLVAA